MRVFIGDTETTGLQGAKAVELAFVEIDPDTLEIQQSWQSLIDPEIPISPGASHIHGIYDKDVEDAPTIEEFVSVILGGPLEGEAAMIAHNVKFDQPFFEPFLNIKQTFCTLSLVRRLFPHRPPNGPENHKLGTMAEYLGLEPGEAHRAMSDVLTVHQMLIKLLPGTGKTLRQHLDIPRHTIFTMPFGEHKGKQLFDLPVGYRRWLLDEANIDADLRYSLLQLRAAGI